MSGVLSESSVHNQVLTAALKYAEGGYKIIPIHGFVAGRGCTCGKHDCSTSGKHPRINAWQQKASSDIAEITQWFTNWPESNIGLQLEGLAALDVDKKTGGLESFAKLQEEFEPLDVRARQISGGGGYHYLFALEDTVTKRLGFRPGLDLLAGSGSYIIVEPSVHRSGCSYSWDSPPHPLAVPKDELAVTTMPSWLSEVAAGRVPTRVDERRAPIADAQAKVTVELLLEQAVAKVSSGEGRNNSGFWLFGQLRDNGYSAEEAGIHLNDWVNGASAASGSSEPYTMREAAASLKSAYAHGAREPWGTSQSKGGDGIVQEVAKDIQSKTSFAKDEGGLLYVFESGVYVPRGENFIKRAVKQYCESNGRSRSWSPELASKVGQWIQADCQELWVKPPLNVVNTKNGLLYVDSRTLEPHSPEFLSPIQIGANFEPGAACPALDAFVKEVFCADSQVVPFELAAWLMLPDVSIQKAVLAIGEGANGKSVFLTLLETFLGKQNATALSLHKIESDRFAAARLFGKLANICPDLPTAALSGTSLFKALTGGDSITGERKFESSFEFRPYARLVFSANSAPRSDDSTFGFFRRWLVIPFMRNFADGDASTVPRAILDARLSSPCELSGLLNRALEALPQVRTGKLTESPSMRAAWDDMRKTTDPLAVWLDCKTVETPEGVIVKEHLRSDYARYCQDAGIPTLSESVFTERLRALRPKVGNAQRRIGRVPKWCFTGIGLLAEQRGLLEPQVRVF